MVDDPLTIPDQSMNYSQETPANSDNVPPHISIQNICKNLLFIDSRVREYDRIISSINNDTTYIVFDYAVDTIDTLKTKIAALSMDVIVAVGIVQDNYISPNYQWLRSMQPALLQDIKTMDASLNTWTDVKDFCLFLKNEKGTEYYDLLACNTYSNPDWVYALDQLETACGMEFRASSDTTGWGGNWILESDNVDLTTIYFTHMILQWQYTLASTIVSNTIIDQAWCDTLANWPATINAGVTITFAGPLSLTSNTKWFQVGGDNVTIDGAGYLVTLTSAMTNWLGLVNNTSYKNNITIKHIGITTDVLLGCLAVQAGYICQKMFGVGNNAILACTNNNIFNCYNTGPINDSVSAGGIFGANAGKFNGKCTANNCYVVTTSAYWLAGPLANMRPTTTINGYSATWIDASAKTYLTNMEDGTSNIWLNLDATTGSTTERYLLTYNCTAELITRFGTLATATDLFLYYSGYNLVITKPVITALYGSTITFTPATYTKNVITNYKYTTSSDNVTWSSWTLFYPELTSTSITATIPNTFTFVKILAVDVVDGPSSSVFTAFYRNYYGSLNYTGMLNSSGLKCNGEITGVTGLTFTGTTNTLNMSNNHIINVGTLTASTISGVTGLNSLTLSGATISGVTSLGCTSLSCVGPISGVTTLTCADLTCTTGSINVSNGKGFESSGDLFWNVTNLTKYSKLSMYAWYESSYIDFTNQINFRLITNVTSGTTKPIMWCNDSGVGVNTLIVENNNLYVNSNIVLKTGYLFFNNTSNTLVVENNNINGDNTTGIKGINNTIMFYARNTQRVTITSEGLTCNGSISSGGPIFVKSNLIYLDTSNNSYLFTPGPGNTSTYLRNWNSNAVVVLGAGGSDMLYVTPYGVGIGTHALNPGLTCKGPISFTGLLKCNEYAVDVNTIGFQLNHIQLGIATRACFYVPFLGGGGYNGGSKAGDCGLFFTPYITYIGGSPVRYSRGGFVIANWGNPANSYGTITTDCGVRIAGTCGLHVWGVGGGATLNGAGYSGYIAYVTGLGTFQTGLDGGTYSNTALYCEGWAVTNRGWIGAEFTSYSDIRIKTNIIDIDDVSALATLRLIEPKRYNYVDVVEKGSEPVWGFIAQQVRSVLPYSTSLMQKEIPNIYDIGIVASDMITITLSNKSTSLFQKDTSGNLLGIYLKSITGKEIKTTITSIIDDKTFTIYEALTSTQISDLSQIFVYGSIVDDFHTLDKNAIFTIATAALQELDREYQATRLEVTRLTTQVDTLTSQNASLSTIVSNMAAEMDALIARVNLLISNATPS